MYRISLFCSMVIWSTAPFAQQRVDTVIPPAIPPLPPPASTCMSDYAAQVYQNKSFAAIATGQSKTSDLANYAAFDVAKGELTLNGFVAFSGKPRSGKAEDSTRSYLSFAFQGGLLNSNSTVLFENAKLNTGVSLSGKYHFRLKNLGIGGGHILCLGTEASTKDAEIRRLRTEDSIMQTAVDLKYDRKMAEYYLLLLRKNDSLFQRQLAALKEEANHKPTSALLKSIDSLGRAVVSNQLNEDSVVTLLQHWADRVNAAKRNVRDTYQQKILETELTTHLFSMNQDWFTVIAAVNNQTYYTYLENLPFPRQLSKNTFTTYSLGLQMNLYWQNLTDVRKRRVDYLNIGLLQQRDNNTGDLNTEAVHQTKTTTQNDTTREVTTSYCAYTSPVVSFNEWNLYLNYYHLFGPKVFSGFHVYPDIEFRSNHETLLNLGFGYVVSFPTKTSGNPVVNAEVYFNFPDLTNDLHAANSVFQRGQFGILIGLPFNFLTK